MNNKLRCNCGGGDKNHIISEGKCYRKEAVGELIPINFRTVNNMKMCDVNGYSITEFTLYNQRLYHQHEDGRWSLTKSGSKNTIDFN